MTMEPSCSDCKIELIQRKWTHLLLKWINKCVSTHKVKKLNPKSLADVMAKYNKDVCANDIDRAMLCTDDVEPFIKYKYPILRLHYLCEESDQPRRIYITTSLILYHCCMSSRTGAVDGDICKQLTKYEQELILKFCENLCEMEATVNNVERAIINAYENIGLMDIEPSDQMDTISSDLKAQASGSTTKGSMTTLPSDDTIVTESGKKPILSFNPSITVLPSFMAETSTYSDLMTDSDDNNATYADSDKINVYNVENAKDKTKLVSLKAKAKGVKQDEAKTKGAKQLGDEAKTKGVKQSGDESPSSDDNQSPSSDENQTPSGDEHARSKHKIFDKPVNNDINKEKEVASTRLDKETSNPCDGKDKDKNICCTKNCSCSRCANGDQAGNNLVGATKPGDKKKKKSFFKFPKFPILSKSMKIYVVAICVLVLVIIAVVCATIPFLGSEKPPDILRKRATVLELVEPTSTEGHEWQCIDGLCQKTYRTSDTIFNSFSRCSLICMGPQLWPCPIGYTYFSNKIVALSTTKLEYKFQSLPSEAVHQYLAEAFKLFIEHLVRLENNDVANDNITMDLTLKKMSIQIDVESDADPRLRVNTEEAYHLKIESLNEKVVIKISSASFCGVRHGLETLSQMILQDQSTGMLITLSNAVIKDAPTYRYRGLMIDTGRNYIPVPDLMRTIDAMATVKLNTFHWRISDVTSFPLFLPKLPELFEYGAYDRSSVYTKDDVSAIVSRAGFRGIRVLIEVAAPGPVGRPWSWSPDVTCPSKNDNYTCNNALCLRMNMKDSIFNVLRTIYTEILEMTNVDDIIHLSDGIFSLTNCFYLVEDRDGFLDKVLAVVQQANKGFIPKLPVIWYTPHLMQDYEAMTWDRLGVQLNDVNPEATDNYLSKFKVIHSSKWDLSCEMSKHRCKKYRTWQEMYAWKSWRNIEVFTIEGGEAVLWTDLVNSANLDGHLWPRAAAVAERLWSDTVLNVTVDGPGYVRLDTQRWRMLFRGINVQPIWPIWCSFHTGVCLQKLRSQRK